LLLHLRSSELQVVGSTPTLSNPLPVPGGNLLSYSMVKKGRNILRAIGVAQRYPS
jgi:hypothetical protein